MLTEKMLELECKDFNFPSDGYVVVRLHRVDKDAIKVTVRVYKPFKESYTAPEYFMEQETKYVWDNVRDSLIMEVYEKLLAGLNYTDRFSSTCDYKENNLKIYSRERDLDYLDWFSVSLFSFDEEEEPFTVTPFTDDATVTIRSAEEGTVLGLPISSVSDRSSVIDIS